MAGKSSQATAMKQPHINPHESLSGLARFFTQELKKQAIDQGIKKIPVEAAKSIIGETETTKSHGEDMKPGQEYTLKSGNKAEKPKGEKLAGIDYRREIVHGTEMINSRQMSEYDRKLHELRSEIARLASSIQAVTKEAKAMSVEQAPKTAGKYHVNFMEWMLSVVRAARMKVEDSGAWLAVSKKKNGYAQKAQNLGTKFTLSQERTVATQSG